MKSYSAARSLIAFLSGVGWLAIGIALVLGALALQRVGLLGAVTLAVPLALAGLILIGVAQMAAAQIDTACNTGEMVTLLHAMKADMKAPTGADGRVATAPQNRAPGSPIENYQGRLIKSERNGVSVDGQGFGSVDAARAWIDEAR